MIVGAAVVGPTGRPLYLAELGPGASSDTLRLQQLLHCSLDVVDERVAAGGSGVSAGGAGAAAPATSFSPPSAPYLGLVYSADRRRVYAYAAPTRLVILLVVEDAAVRDADASQVCRRLHFALADAVSNPFYVRGSPITSAKFDASVRAIATSLEG